MTAAPPHPMTGGSAHIEVLLHLSGYVGVPLIREAMMVASKVFAEVRAEAE